MSDEIVPSGPAVDSSIAIINDSVPAPEDRVYPFGQLQDNVWPKLKRAFDFIAAVILLPLVLPLGCLIVLLIATSGQRPFYSYVRVGRNGREFGCLTFGTLRDDPDVTDTHAKLVWETNRARQVTRLGQVLRDTGLADLPQLLNVLRGDMSFVGPRPVDGDELARSYSPLEAATYLSVRPGLTDWGAH